MSELTLPPTHEEKMEIKRKLTWQQKIDQYFVDRPAATDAQIVPPGFLTHRAPGMYQETRQFLVGDRVQTTVRSFVFIDTDGRPAFLAGEVMEVQDDGTYLVLLDDGRQLDFYRWEIEPEW